MIWCWLLGGYRDVPRRRLVMDYISAAKDPPQPSEDPGRWLRSRYSGAPTQPPQDPDSDGCLLPLVMVLAIVVIMILMVWAVPQIAHPAP